MDGALLFLLYYFSLLHCLHFGGGQLNSAVVAAGNLKCQLLIYVFFSEWQLSGRFFIFIVIYIWIYGNVWIVLQDLIVYSQRFD